MLKKCYDKFVGTSLPGFILLLQTSTNHNDYSSSTDKDILRLIL